MNHAVLTVERATLINGFWSDHHDRLDLENGDVVRSAIRLFGQSIINPLLGDGGACFGIDNNNAGSYWTEELQTQDGWGGSFNGDPFGWCCIRLIAADVETVEFDSVELVEVARQAPSAEST